MTLTTRFKKCQFPKQMETVTLTRVSSEATLENPAASPYCVRGLAVKRPDLSYDILAEFINTDDNGHVTTETYSLSKEADIDTAIGMLKDYEHHSLRLFYRAEIDTRVNIESSLQGLYADPPTYHYSRFCQPQFNTAAMSGKRLYDWVKPLMPTGWNLSAVPSPRR